jgi:hypothetical protein
LTGVIEVPGMRPGVREVLAKSLHLAEKLRRSAIPIFPE